MGSKPIGISASRGAAVCGLSKFQTRFHVWQLLCEQHYGNGWNESQGYALPESPDNAPIRWGNAFETQVIKLAEKHQSSRINKREKLYLSQVSKDLVISCHIDGMYPDLRLHEGKTTAEFVWRESWGEPGTHKIPIGYAIQAQHQMICSGIPEVVISVLAWPKRPDEWEKAGFDPAVMSYADKMRWARTLDDMGYFHQYYIPENREIQEQMKARYIRMWEHVLSGTPPKAESVDDLKRLCPEPVGTVVADERVSLWASEYKAIGKEIGTSGALAKRREQLKRYILEYMLASDAIMDDESRDKTVLRDTEGKKLIQWNGKSFR